MRIDELRNKYKSIIFESFKEIEDEKEIRIEYLYKLENIDFIHKITIPKKEFFIQDTLINKEVFLFNLGVMELINYYKLACPKKIILRAGALRDGQKDFFKKLFYKGLGEFRYINNINISYDDFLDFENDTKREFQKSKESNQEGNLIPVGGGKDSIVTLELLENERKLNKCLILNPRGATINTVEVAGYGMDNTVCIYRKIDEKLLKMNNEGYLNGHVPFSAILGFITVFCAYITGKKYVILSNESSANEATDELTGANHQYSKSVEFEYDFVAYIEKYVSSNISYFSLLRGMRELDIARLFSKHKKYHKIFRSCNVGSKNGQNDWCAKCPKCLFVYIMLAPYLEESELINIFGANLLSDITLLPYLEELTGIRPVKPFECVGTRSEVLEAIDLIAKKYQDNLPLLIKKITEKRTVRDNIKNFFDNKRILILGFGREGQSTYNFIKNYTKAKYIAVADKVEQKCNEVCIFGADYMKEIYNNYDIIMKSPGITLKDEDLEKVSAIITSQTDILLKFNKNNIIGITGTKGKSTTASLIYQILKEAKIDSKMIGNIGIPAFECIDDINDNTKLVFEMSSHQLQYVTSSPHVAILLNVFEEHLDYYNSYEDYKMAKAKVFRWQDEDDFLIYNKENEMVNDLVDRFSKAKKEKIEICWEEFGELKGEHNKLNIKTAVKTAQILGIEDNIIKSAIKKFKPLPHRLEYVGCFNNIKYYNDSIATIPQATILAVNTLGNIGTLIVGGMNRGIDYSQFIEFLENAPVKNLVCVYETGEFIYEKLKRGDKYLAKDFEKAVALAKELTEEDDICLLSPAAASYGHFKNFEERGDIFRKLIK